MRVLVISDIHANYHALQAVLKDAGEVDETWCLGDIVGYGPEPNLCVERMRDIPQLTCLLGNHDVAALGRMPLSAFNGDARISLEYQVKVLTSDNIDFLKTLPETVKVRGDATMAHGSPRDPVWEYIINSLSARLNFEHFDTPYCFVGHSHLQSMFHLDEERNRVVLGAMKPDVPYEMQPRTIFNPGSVGQPRDRDPRAAYALYDTEARTWEPRRAEYDIEAVQARIRELKLPERHALRLADGW
jgi:diadenosine tetraphosphatase ApaH/serine/threonine PP2A family protein phosphatase